MKYFFAVFSCCFITACSTFSPLNGKEVTLYVGAKQVDCEGVAPQKCLLTKENMMEEWTYFYDHIAGFQYEAGYEYTLKVRRETLSNPPADASAYRWHLIKVVRKTKVSP